MDFELALKMLNQLTEIASKAFSWQLASLKSGAHCCADNDREYSIANKEFYDSIDTMRELIVRGIK